MSVLLQVASVVILPYNALKEGGLGEKRQHINGIRHLVVVECGSCKGSSGTSSKQRNHEYLQPLVTAFATQ